MRLAAEVRLDVDPATADALAAALGPEVERTVPRTTADVDADDDGLRLRAEANDASAMRAALNSLLRFTHTALDVQDRT